ncbi:MAG: hypothetical protein C0508_20990 [Cyanobacteria bacterium PR.023]|nr:hypothetical protein [Cyanobacteria bacterium PR.023]
MKPALDIVFVTYGDLKQGDPDDLDALEILRKRGYNCSVADWRDSTFPFQSSRLVVLRSTWDYHLHHSEFMAWLKSLASHSVLKNSWELVQWNSDKRYLRDLSARGIDCVPTYYIEEAAEQVTRSALAEILASLSGSSPASSTASSASKVVVKPSIGLSTFGVKKFDLSTAAGQDAALEHINQLARDYCVMVQPFLAEVENYGERALAFIDGEFSHAIRKTAFQHLAVAGEAGEAMVTASADEIAFGYKTLAALSEKPLYARVDIIPDANGALRLLELELIEPSLFLKLAEGASAKMADAVEACLN